MGSLSVIGAIVMWSTLGIILRISGAPILPVMFYSNLVSVFFLGTIVVSRKSLRVQIPRDRRLAYLFVLSLVTVLNSTSFMYSLKHTTIANAMATHYTAPILVAVLAYAFLKEPFTLRLAASIVVASVGLWLLFGTDSMELYRALMASDENAMGVMSGALSGLTYAVIVLLVRVLAQELNPVVLTFIQNLGFGLIMFPFVREFPVEHIPVYLTLGLLHSSLVPLLYVKGMQTVEAGRAAILGYFEPLCAVSLGIVLLGEVPSGLSIVGGVLILFSGAMVIGRGSK